ncbi:MAG: molybdopterin-guanine dinucleotide biosynthesis protein, partial [Candidatus Cloacimonetes bacterium]|nr:molybdopterin-guanine dinucleotide biosynthesis protein [Candidatus Cloacimonadota bacterium]
PRIICADSPEQLQETVDDTVFAISGKISERIDEWNDIPVINARKNIIKLADLTEEKVFAVLPLANAECCRACGYSCQEMVGAILAGKMNRKDCLLLKNEQIGIKVDGRQLTLVPFVRNLFTAIINSLVGNLEGGKGKKIEIIIDE